MKKSELHPAEQELKQFIYAISHDLQEPLRIVTGFNTLLKEEFPMGSVLNEEALEYIDYSLEGVKRMQILLNSLLELSRAGRDPESHKDVFLDSVLKDCVERFLKQSGEPLPKVETSSLFSVFGSETEFGRVFDLLLDNCLKYSSPDRPLSIKVFSEETEDARWIKFQDNGIGIDPTYNDKIFGMFQRLHARDEIPGAGAGLNICRKIMKVYGGDVGLASSQPGEGSCFYLKFPRT